MSDRLFRLAMAVPLCSSKLKKQCLRPFDLEINTMVYKKIEMAILDLNKKEKPNERVFLLEVNDL